MKMEDHFKETLNRAVANEPPVLDAWDRFERRIGRSRRWRLFAGLAGAAAVIVAAVIVVPQLGTGGTADHSADRFSRPVRGVDGSGRSERPVDLREQYHRPGCVTQLKACTRCSRRVEVATPAGEPTFAVTIARLSEDFELPAVGRGPNRPAGSLARASERW